MMEITIRAATEADIDGILAIVNAYAAQNLMLPRNAAQISRVLPDFLVATHEDRVVGCGSNVPLTLEVT
jgi:amino-acid N-acetyltransferase